MSITFLISAQRSDTQCKYVIFHQNNPERKDIKLRLVQPVRVTWWRHQMETFSVLLAICAGNSPVPMKSQHKGQWRGALMFSLIYALNKRLRKHSWGWWFETQSRPLWRHCNVRHCGVKAIDPAYTIAGLSTLRQIFISRNPPEAAGHHWFIRQNTDPTDTIYDVSYASP